MIMKEAWPRLWQMCRKMLNMICTERNMIWMHLDNFSQGGIEDDMNCWKEKQSGFTGSTLYYIYTLLYIPMYLEPTICLILFQIVRWMVSRQISPRQRSILRGGKYISHLEAAGKKNSNWSGRRVSIKQLQSSVNKKCPTKPLSPTSQQHLGIYF